MKRTICWKLALLLIIGGEMSFVYGQDTTPIKIGIIGAEEGAYSFFEKSILDGILYALAACRREQSDSSLNGAWVKHWWPTPKAIARFGRLCTCHREFFRHQTS